MREVSQMTWGRSQNYSGEFREGLYDGYGVFSTAYSYYEGFFQRDFSMDKAFIRLKDEKVPSSEEYQCFSYLGTK